MSTCFHATRRQFLGTISSGMTACLLPFQLRAQDPGLPADNPIAALNLPWINQLPWARVVDVTTMDGSNDLERLDNAQASLAARGGGVVYFPPGTYRFSQSLKLLPGIILRGAPPRPVTDARNKRYSLRTRFEFPKFEPVLEGEGTPILTAFKGIYLSDPLKAENCGVVHLDIHRGHIHFQAGPQHQAGRNRFVYGCILRNAAVADPSVPNLELGQHPWQRFTRRHFSAIDVKSNENILVANNRLPRSGEDNFTMNGYLMGRGKETMSVDGVVFDYDNRPGLYINHYALGGAGGSGPDGTPETHPHGFRKGIVIRDNYIYNTGRMAIGFAGDGVMCADNVIRFAKDQWRPTNTGQRATSGSSTNDNRAVEMRGWRWVVTGNDYEVHRNWALDRNYLINDGEGLMHEDHVNSTIKDSVLSGNQGNAYLSLYKCAGIDGLRVSGNDIRVDPGRKSPAEATAIYVSADRNSGRHPCRNVTITKNHTAGGGILISGEPAENNMVWGNTYVGEGKARILNRANARVEGNLGFLD